VPYEVSFTKRVPLLDRDKYINECCVGGDKVVERLLPAVRKQYGGDLEGTQEDWGWFIWFQAGGVKLAVDVFTDDPDLGEFRVHLTSRTKRLLFLDSVVDTPELETLRALVTSELEAWVGGPVRVARIDADR
jgi:hypothetical protein